MSTSSIKITVNSVLYGLLLLCLVALAIGIKDIKNEQESQIEETRQLVDFLRQQSKQSDELVKLLRQCQAREEGSLESHHRYIIPSDPFKDSEYLRKRMFGGY